MGKWFEDWFADKDYLKVYGHRDSDDAKQLIETVLSQIDVPKNAKVLDAACGAGRYSHLLAGKGFNVTGFDLSKQLLEVANKNFEHSVNLFRADLRSIQFKEKFDLIFNVFTSFGYFESDEENFLFIKNAYTFLHNGGYFVFDFLNKDFVINNLNPKTEKELDGLSIVETREIVDGRVVKKITLRRDQGIKEFVESVRLYDKDKIISEFENIGYNVKKVFGDYLGKEYNSQQSARLIIIFQK